MLVINDGTGEKLILKDACDGAPILARHVLFLAVSGRAGGVIFRSVNIGLRDHKNNGILHSVK